VPPNLPVSYHSLRFVCVWRHGEGNYTCQRLDNYLIFISSPEGKGPTPHTDANLTAYVYRSAQGYIMIADRTTSFSPGNIQLAPKPQSRYFPVSIHMESRFRLGGPHDDRTPHFSPHPRKATTWTPMTILSGSSFHSHVPSLENHGEWQLTSVGQITLSRHA
jgi:hypothetical protein